MRLSNRKISSGNKFLSTMAVVYFFVWLFNKSLFNKSFNEFWIMFFKTLPILGLVFGVMFLINFFVSPEMIKKYLGKSSGKRGFLYSFLASIIIAGPPYIIFPLLGELKQHGMKSEFIATFLYNRNVQIPFIPAMIFYFGWRYTLVVSFYIIIFAFLSGVLVGKIVKE